MNWLNSHHNQCSKLTRNYEVIKIRDSIAATLRQYLNALSSNCGFGGDKVEKMVGKVNKRSIKTGKKW